MSNKVIVTGAGGQLGRELQVAAPSYPQFEFIFLTRQELAIENKDAVNKLFQSIRPAFCINCAAYTAVDKAESDQENAFLINSEATGILAGACALAGAKLLHVSTDYVFNGNGNVPYKEDNATDPVNLYGASKLKGEQLAMLQDGVSIIIRTSWVYSEFGHNFVKTMMRLMKERDSLNVVADQIGSPTYARDLAHVILEIISSGKWVPGIYNYSNDGVINWYQFALQIKEVIGSHCEIFPVPTTSYPTPAKRPSYSVLDKQKIKATYSVALNDWKTSLSECILQIQGSSPSPN